MINHLAFLLSLKTADFKLLYTVSLTMLEKVSDLIQTHFPKISLFHFYIKKNIINKEILYNKIYNKINFIEQSVMLKMIRWNDRLYMKSKHVNH